MTLVKFLIDRFSSGEQELIHILIRDRKRGVWKGKYIDNGVGVASRTEEGRPIVCDEADVQGQSHHQEECQLSHE